jgi:hypothetical protein
MLETHFLSEDEYLVRLSWSARMKLTRQLLTAHGGPLLAAVLAATVAWGVIVSSLWSLAGVPLKALIGYQAAVAEVGSVEALAGRLALFSLLAGAVSSVVLLSLNNLLDHYWEGDGPATVEEAAEALLAPWARLRHIWGALAAWSLLGAAWGAALALASLPPFLGVLPVLAGVPLFLLLQNCAMWYLLHQEQEEPGLWAAVALPCRLLAHSEVLWRKTLTTGLAACLPGLALTGAALSPLPSGPGWTLGLFLTGAALLTGGLTFLSCFFALNYRQALANYRLRCRPAPPARETEKIESETEGLEAFI